MKALDAFRMLGAKVSEVKISHWERADSVYSIISTSDAASNLTRYDSVRFGGAEGESIVDAREGFGDEVRMRILLGNAVLTSEEKLHLRKKAESERMIIKESFEKMFEHFDLLITPTAYHTAPFKDDAKDKLTDYFLTAPSVDHLPSLSLPMGFSENGMPLGLQIIGNSFTEDVILRAAYTFEEARKDEIYKKGGAGFEF
jgi:aspartyl-tRNA(Asn)/glutamyl-tRNA(Gln) amidotransferase subunit A